MSARYHPVREKLATPDEVLAEIRRMTVKDREYVEAELLRDAYDSGRIEDPPGFLDEVTRRAEDALGHPEGGMSREEAVAGI